MKQRLFFVLIVMTMLPGVNVAQSLQWQPTNGPWGGSVSGFIAKDSVILAWAETGTYRSTNNGNSWQEVAGQIGPFAIGGSMIYGLGNDGGIYRSSDDGMTWMVVATGSFTCIAANGSTVIAQGESILRSINDGDSWDTISAIGLSGKYIQAIAITKTSIIAGTSAGMYRSTDTGNSWEEVLGVLKDSGIQMMIQSPSTIYAAGGADAQSNYMFSHFIVVSTDEGATWNYANQYDSGRYVSSMMADDSTLYVIDAWGPLYVSSDSLKSWREIQSPAAYENIWGVYGNGQTIFLATESGGVVRSEDAGKSWKAENVGIYAYGASSLTPFNDSILVLTNSSGVFRSQDYGNSWNPKDSGVSDSYCQKMVSDSSDLYLAAMDGLEGNIFRSTDDGNSWDTTNASLSTQIDCLSAVADTIYAVSYGAAQVSTDQGNTWSNCSGIPGNAGIISTLKMGAGVVYASGDGHLYRSFDRGLTWTPIDTGMIRGAFVIYANGSSIFVTVNQPYISGTLFRSDDYGSSWQRFTSLPVAIGSIIVQGNTFIAATESGVYVSPDEGVTWSPQNEGLTDSTEVSSMVVAGSKIFASTANSGVFVADFVNSSVELTEPYEVGGLAVFPNPSSAFTAIRYNLFINGSVSITVIDPLGRVIAKPLDGEFQAAGQHEIQLDASALTPGIYLCRLSAGGLEQETKFVVER